MAPTPYWDGVLMHLATQLQLKHGSMWQIACDPNQWYPRGAPRPTGEVATCLRCIAAVSR